MIDVAVRANAEAWFNAPPQAVKSTA